MSLHVQDVVKHFGGIKAVDGASFEVHPGTITGLIGPNGAGKTTLFDCITGFQQPDAGRIHFDGTRIDRLPPHMVTRHGIARTFQLVRLLPAMSALENLMVATPNHAGERLAGALFGGWQGDEHDARAHARDWLERVGMGERAEVPGGQLSYGQSKLVELARVLMLETPMLLLDEPMSGINPTLRSQLLAHLRALRDAGKTVLVIEHDMEMIMAVCDDVVVMDQGRVIAQGSPSEVRNNPRVIEAYLGRGKS